MKLSLHGWPSDRDSTSMKFLCDGVETHLSYCTNIHAGDDWQDAFARLKTHLPEVRRELGQTGPMGIGLRLSSRSANALTNDEVLEDFRSWLLDNDYYVFTVNGFPYGPFHGERVKEDVYKPDWTEAARLDYTCRLADILARLDPPGKYASISTLPGTFKDWVMGGTEEAMVENLIRAVAHLVSIEQQQGVTIALALEPEPCCYLETVSETVRFFRRWIFSGLSIARLAELTGLEIAQAKLAMQRHIGACYDVCHSAVEFESPGEAIAALQCAGIPIVKIQLSSALKIDKVSEATLRQLSHFDEPVYLHQVVERRSRLLHRYNDLRVATTAFRQRLDRRADIDARHRLSYIDGATALAVPEAIALPDDEPCEWRVHFHVPVFMEQLEHFGTTRESLEELIDLQRRYGICPHLEVETYTWDVLPDELRDVTIAEAIAREIDWVRSRLIG